MRVREAGPGDAAAIAAVYAHHVLHGTGTFEEEPPDAAEIAARMGRGRWFVAVDDPEGPDLLGYAYHAPYRPRSAYRRTVEDSVYVHPGATGRGVGSALLAHLLDDARAAGLRVVLAAVGDSGNAASLALHERHGFVRVGVLRGVGVKFGRSLDVVFLQRDL